MKNAGADEPGGDPLGEAQQDERDAARRPADLGDEVEDGHPEGQQRGQGHAQDQAHDQDAQPGDARHQHRSGHVAADRLVGQPADAVGLGPPGGWHQAPQPPDEALAVEEQADGDEQGEEERR